MKISILAGNPRIYSTESAETLEPQELAFRYGLHLARQQKEAGNEVKLSVIVDHKEDFSRFLKKPEASGTLANLQARFRNQFERACREFDIPMDEVLVIPEEHLKKACASSHFQKKLQEYSMVHSQELGEIKEVGDIVSVASCGPRVSECRAITAMAVKLLSADGPDDLWTVWQNAGNSDSVVVTDGTELAVRALGVKNVQQTYIREHREKDKLVLEKSIFQRGEEKSFGMFEAKITKEPKSKMALAEFERLLSPQCP